MKKKLSKIRIFKSAKTKTGGVRNRTPLVLVLADLACLKNAYFTYQKGYVLSLLRKLYHAFAERASAFATWRWTLTAAMLLLILYMMYSVYLHYLG